MAQGNPLGWLPGSWDTGAWASSAWGFHVTGTATATATGASATGVFADATLPMSYKVGYGAGLSIVLTVGPLLGG